ncbi:MAG: tRNA (guanosine(46)-N7)-methyltransferase TrmB [Hyphomicrobiales bacterium]
MNHRTKKSDFIGRRKTKPLKPGPSRLVKELLPELKISPEMPASRDLALLFPDTDRVYLEIGFGSGEHLIHRASNDPTTGYIGVEPFINGLSQALVQIDARGLGNIRLYDDDAGAFLDWLPERSLERVSLLYPDPWHKFKHWKRRFVSVRNLDRIARVLKPGGLFLFASDIEHYVGWTLNQCHSHFAFDWPALRAEEWNQTDNGAFGNWPGTRYEAKALREGRLPTYLTFTRMDT